jgi:dipeptidyl aminopeptidase/acylaminoacyl peptidase
MRRVAVFLALALVAFTPVSSLAQAKKRPITVEDLFRFKRVGDPQISPDGKQVAYVLTSVDLAGNKSTSRIWLAPTAGGEPRPLTSTTRRDRHPRWSPDGKQILFESKRSGENQLWVIAIDGGEARQLTTIATEASTGIWSPDGSQIAFVSAVWPEFSDKPYAESNALNKKRQEEKEKNPVKARVFTRLFFRHFDSYVEDKRQHLFVLPWNGGKGGEPRDVTPGDRDAYPTSTTFSVGDDFTFSPDGKYLVYTAPPEKDEAWSTNYDIWRVPVAGGGKTENLTKDNPAADGAPQFSPDGKQLAYRAQRRPGFEADKWELMVVDVDASSAIKDTAVSCTGKVCDYSVEEFAWGKQNWGVEKGKTLLYFLAEFRGTRQILSVPPKADSFNPPGGLMPNGASSSLSISRDGQLCAHTWSTLCSPNEVMIDPLTPLVVPDDVSRANQRLLEELDLPPPASTLPGVDGAPMQPVQMWILKPPGFDPAKKWPLVYLVHGGPQSAWLDAWHYRWNPQVWAAQGYVVALPNPRGSTGFGQKYVDEISGDWGGKCYEDLMKGVDYLEKLPYIDKDRIAAAGASFGGYMMNWFQGNTTRFKTLITHCGVYNNESMYATTEELWFDEWDHGDGKPLWENRAKYQKHSPHLLAKNFKTPMLVIHNDLDFRVPVSQGIELFTTLQRLGIPSRMVNFPDEGHWVVKPANSAYWHKEVFDWLKKYVPPGGR